MARTVMHRCEWSDKYARPGAMRGPDGVSSTPAFKDKNGRR
jgi:hypothetical protein